MVISKWSCKASLMWQPISEWWGQDKAEDCFWVNVLVASSSANFQNTSHLLSFVSLVFQLTMASRLCLLVMVALTGWVAVQATNYCKFTREHTMCKFHGRGPRCGPEIGIRGISPKDINLIVDLHNKLRAHVARGEEHRGKPGPQPRSANMMALVSVHYSRNHFVY